VRCQSPPCLVPSPSRPLTPHPSLPHTLTRSSPHSLTPALPHTLTPSPHPSPPHTSWHAASARLALQSSCADVTAPPALDAPRACCGLWCPCLSVRASSARMPICALGGAVASRFFFAIHVGLSIYQSTCWDICRSIYPSACRTWPAGAQRRLAVCGAAWGQR